MLLIEELVRFGRRLDDGWHHPAGGAAAEAWGLPAPRFVRSSASHVMVAARPDGDGRVVLRLRPDTEEHRATFGRAAAAAAAWSAAGAPFAPPLPSASGALVESVDGYVAMAMEVVEGETLEDDGLPDAAVGWGRALAELHAAAPAAAVLPHAVDLLGSREPQTWLAELVADLREQLARLPRSDDVHGTLHGDPEADNVVAGPGGPRFVDPDEVRSGWYAADIAFALRDFGAPGCAPDLAADVPRRFLEGYGQVRTVSGEELEWLPLMARASAAEDLVGFQPHLDAVADTDWPDWATRLDARIRERAAALREAVVGR